MPSYKVSNNPRMYFCANNVICSIHASLLLEVRQVCAFKSYLNILFYTKKQINKIITFNFTRSREKYIT